MCVQAAVRTTTLRSVGQGNSVLKCPKQSPCSPPNLCRLSWSHDSHTTCTMYAGGGAPYLWLAPPACRAAPASSAASS